MNSKKCLLMLLVAPFLAATAVGQEFNNFTKKGNELVTGRYKLERVGGADEIKLRALDTGILITIPTIVAETSVEYCNNTKTLRVQAFALPLPGGPAIPFQIFDSRLNSFGFAVVIVFDGCEAPVVSQILTQDAYLVQKPGDPPPPTRIFVASDKKPSTGTPHVDTVDPVPLQLTFTSGKGKDKAKVGGVFFDMPNMFAVTAGRAIWGLNLQGPQVKWVVDMNAQSIMFFKTFIGCSCGNATEHPVVFHWRVSIFVRAGGSFATSIGSAAGHLWLVEPVPGGDLAELNLAITKLKKVLKAKKHHTLFYEEIFSE